MAVRALDLPRSEWHASLDRSLVVQILQAVAQVTVPTAHRRFHVTDARRFHTRLERFQPHLRTALPQFLLSLAPPLGGLPPGDRFPGARQGLADVIQVDPGVGTLAEPPPDLLDDPDRPVADTVQPRLLAPTGLRHTNRETLPGLLHPAQARPGSRRHTPPFVRSRHARFSPTPRARFAPVGGLA